MARARYPPSLASWSIQPSSEVLPTEGLRCKHWRIWSCARVKTTGALKGRAALPSLVTQKTRQLRMLKRARRFTKRSAVRKRESSARQPDFRIL